MSSFQSGHLARVALCALLVGGVGSLGCVGSIGDGDGVDGQTQKPICQSGPSPMRRLTRWEYDHTVYDLLGDDTSPASAFTPEAVQFGFDNNASGATLSDGIIEQYETAAGDIAHRAAADMAGLLECDPVVEGEDECVASFVRTFGRRAYRRPLTADEEQRFGDLYRTTKTGYGFELAVETVVSAFLQSPNFLYRIEMGMPDPKDPEVVPLDAFEVASRLSFLLWGSTPDDALLDAAESGQLATKEQIAEQAKRMLDDERGARAIQNFFGQWAGARNLSDLDRGDQFSTEVADLERNELDLFVDDVVRKGDGRYGTLLTSNVTYLNDDLAKFYGLPAPGSDDFVKVELDPQRYPGILTRGAPMTLLAHPGQPSIVLRGKFVLQNLLCEEIPPPPDNVDISLPAEDPNATARQQIETKTSVEPCVTCHSVLNPAGFAFDHFDELGRWRDDEHGLAIDTSGTIQGSDVDGDVADQKALADKLAESSQARQCMVLQWFRYAYGRDQTDSDSCTMDGLGQAFSASDGNLRELLIDLTQTDAFLFRSPVGGDQ